MTSPLFEITHVTAEQNSKTVTINEMHDDLEEAVAGHSADIVFTSDANLDISDTSASPLFDVAVKHVSFAVTSSVTMTTGKNLIVPDTTKFYLIYNNVTGSVAFTVKTSAGSGISVPAAKRQLLYCDGTNVVRAGSAQTG